MRDYIGEMLRKWHGYGDEKALDEGLRLLRDIEVNRACLDQHEQAILAVGKVIKHRKEYGYGSEEVSEKAGGDRGAGADTGHDG